MTTTADLIAEARRLHAYPFVLVNGVSIPVSVPNFAAQANDLLPQLADALVEYHAEVRKSAIIRAEPRWGPVFLRCRLCDGEWLPDTAESHRDRLAPSCPARPMEDA